MIKVYLKPWVVRKVEHGGKWIETYVDDWKQWKMKQNAKEDYVGGDAVESGTKLKHVLKHSEK